MAHAKFPLGSPRDTPKKHSNCRGTLCYFLLEQLYKIPGGYLIVVITKERSMSELSYLPGSNLNKVIPIGAATGKTHIRNGILSVHSI